MKPDEFSWTEDQQVTVTNPTAETYAFKVYGKDYQVEAGQTVKMPGFIAWLYVYGLSTQLAQADGTFNRWNEEGFRQEYYDRLVIGADSLVQAVEPVLPEIEPVTVPQSELPPGGATYDPAEEQAEPAAEAPRRGRPART